MNKNSPASPDLQKKITDLIQDISTKCKNGKYIYRGVNEIHEGVNKKELKNKDRINSSIYREYNKLAKIMPFIPPLHIQEDIVNRARRLYPNNPDREEILTDFRHFGGQTNLIDFSQIFILHCFLLVMISMNKTGN